MHYVIYLTRDGNKSLSRNFTAREFQCSDGNSLVVVNEELVKKLQKLRENISRPIIISSGFRTLAHNKKVGGSKTSYHMSGDAADIIVRGVPLKDLTAACKALNFGGVIQYTSQGFVHVDVRKNPYWSYA